MTASELVLKKLADSGFQVNAVLDGISELQADAKILDFAMSPRETLVHLSECCVAFNETCQGIDHNWGTYTSSAATLADLKTEFDALRTEVVSRVADDEKVLKAASGFIVLHEAYHVGQLALLRLHLDSEWNAYSIYNH
ncbi:MAG: hypothetical protein ABL949_08650 [Fimbriimonadaceae bacterium]